MTIIGIDIGQSGSRARLAGSLGTDVITGPGYWSAPVPQLVHDLVVALSPGRSALKLGIGLTGYEPQTGQAVAIGSALLTSGIAARVAVADDGLTAYLGALGDTAGGLIAAGTGSVALALDPGTAMARTDGWGSELGDHGSGYWIGREAIRQALRLVDGQQADSLTGALAEQFGPIESISALWRRQRPGVDEIAAFAHPVIELARGGNATCQALLDRAAQQLAESLAMALRRAGLAERQVPYAALGGIFAAGDLVGAPFRRAMRDLVPAAFHKAAIGDALDGCIRLAELAPDPVLRPLYETFGD